MLTVVNIWGYTDLTDREYVFEKEVIVEAWKSLQEAVIRLVDQLNQENSLILYYILVDEENNHSKQQLSSWTKWIIDKWYRDSL
jgi:hypothetical protein